MSIACKFSLCVVLTSGAALFAHDALACSSNDMRRHYCSVDTRGGVSMIRQRSDSPCVEGRTWGYDRSGIWVDRGCRADFEVGGYGRGGYSNGGWGNYPYDGGYGNYPYGGVGGYAASMSCSSNDMRRHYCAADTRGGVTMIRQRSDASCIEGRTWGYDRSGIWVDRGCRADFALGTGSRGYGRGGPGR
jgi:DUF3011 family protein